METQTAPVMGKGEGHTERLAHCSKKRRSEMGSLVRDKTSQERKTLDTSIQGKWKSGGRELQRAPEADVVEAITAGKATQGFWPDGHNKGFLELPSVEVLVETVGSGGDILPLLRAPG